ncbi:hypothetical protein PENFLA_c100G04817 [Penicillium flavigenum]|uniref:Uncharacterized protein n=1 Tax=Penicillium flavigenum TaxID=254877 RepID=A0A1V6S344_9EURO|nr:hypothetical protein PENFLA_c194G04876 [Penicillium flavigenum]OQE08164.1 hypothetical protein PENFLA_c146G01922 [Penicillium flavigenum]OQE09716.1 hypothetical protein PENFLA_c100G04817 [Penicillium flavigenum]
MDRPLPRFNPLDWTPWCEPEFWHEESAVHHLAWHSAKAQGATFMFGYLKDKWDDDIDMENRVGAAQKLQHGTIVMRVIVAHTTVRNAFGDAPIQLVDISDDQRLDAFFAFAEECESYAQGFLTKGQRFYRESLESIKTREGKTYRNIWSPSCPDSASYSSHHHG